MTDFIPFPKIPRLSRDCVITEKLDGTNASIWIDRFYNVPWRANQVEAQVVASIDDGDVQGPALIRAGSRTRFLTPGKQTDNFGFAAWVKENAEELVELGIGTHYGEWWGRGIQRGYGLDERRFSLFNVGRWVDARTEPSAPVYGSEVAPVCCHVVPVLSRGPFTTAKADSWLHRLLCKGSYAAPGFMKPEGIIVYHEASRQLFKKTFDDNHKEAA